MTERQPGDTVDVQIRGARVVESETMWIELRYDHKQYSVGLRPDVDAVTITRAAPPEWPPQAGDTWRTAGGVRQIFAADGTLEADDPHDSGFSIPVADLDPVGATLLFRLETTA